MTDPQALGALANIHELQLRLVETLPPGECNRRFEHGLPSAGWLLGRAVYLELHLLRNRVRGDDDLASRVRHLFDNARSPAAALDAKLPPQDHLLSWAHEIFDEHLVWLANPGMLPDHPLLADGWLVWQLAQHQALIYERLLTVLTARSARRSGRDYRVSEVLMGRLPRDDSTRIERGHYRIGARGGPVLGNEQPAQLVELHAFRISRAPAACIPSQRCAARPFGSWGHPRNATFSPAPAW
jgi:iron(II)-dependent oxidoreductase